MSQATIKKSISPIHSKKEILQELKRILSSDLFSRSSVLSNFLKFIVEETLEGNTDSLKEYTIAVIGLGKSSRFDPKSNAIIRINAGRLRRLLKEYYETSGITDPIKIEVVKGTYVPLFRKQSINTLIPEKKNDVGKIINTYSRSKLTLAILPFRNLLPDKEYQFFVDGFGEELTRIFSTSEDISVVAHFSTLKYSNHIEDIRIVGTDLGVHYVIMGSVMRSATKIRVNIGLIETMNGMQIWSKEYTHDLEKNKTIDIQDRINHDVFAMLSGHYGFIMNDTMRQVEADMKQDLESFDAVLWYNLTQITHSEADCLTCRKALEKVLEKEPNNVMCLVILADLYLFTYSLGFALTADPVNEAFTLIKKALRLAPLSQFGNLILGWANIYLGKKSEAIAGLEYSMQLAPLSPSLKGTVGFAFSCAGDYERGQRLIKEALELNPYCPWWYYLGLFFACYANGQFEKALSCAQSMNASDDVYLIPLLKAAAKGQMNMLDQAKGDVRLLQNDFQEILSNLKIYLSTFMLDASLIDDIILGARKAGLAIP